MPVRLIVFCALTFTGATTRVFAQSSLGIGSSEEALVNPGDGLFPGFLAWVAVQQREFYQLMTEALIEMQHSPVAWWALVGLSFLYGVLHAVGPGHGKVVISSYMLATETQLRRGILISFATSALQAVCAIVIVGLGFLVFRRLSVSVSDATQGFEVASYLMVTALGSWLVVRSVQNFRVRSAASRIASSCADHEHTHTHHNHSHSHNHASGVCASCGHSHMPTLHQTEQSGSLREALTAVFSVGLRPCTGALVVLTFSFMNGIWWAGIGATFAMALGTAMSVSALAAVAVGAKGFAKRYAGIQSFGPSIIGGIEVVGGVLILLVGASLLQGALAG